MVSIFSSSAERARAIAEEFGLRDDEWVHVPISDEVRGFEYPWVAYDEPSEDLDISDILRTSKSREY